MQACFQQLLHFLNGFFILEKINNIQVLIWIIAMIIKHLRFIFIAGISKIFGNDCIARTKTRIDIIAECI